MIRYITAERIEQLNTFLILKYSSAEQLETKFPGVLEMIVNQPFQDVFGQELYPTIEEKAATLMINVIKKHPFHNANKRTAVATTDIFLQMNGSNFQITPDESEEIVVGIATYDSENFDELKDLVSKFIREKTIRTGKNGDN